MQNSEKQPPQGLAERIGKLRESPAFAEAMKAVDHYTASALAKLNELLARLNAKK
jgi:hypothetical protein